jgi:hypothetical protein
MQSFSASPARAGLWLPGAALLSLFAGFIHLLAAPPYFDIWVGYGLFFALAVTAQMTFAVILWIYHTVWRVRPAAAWLWAGLIGNGLIVLLWAYTRTLGIPPLGPQAGLVLPVGALDLLAVAAEVGVIGCLALLLRQRQA